MSAPAAVGVIVASITDTTSISCAVRFPITTSSSPIVVSVSANTLNLATARVPSPSAVPVSVTAANLTEPFPGSISGTYVPSGR